MYKLYVRFFFSISIFSNVYALCSVDNMRKKNVYLLVITDYNWKILEKGLLFEKYLYSIFRIHKIIEKMTEHYCYIYY